MKLKNLPDETPEPRQFSVEYIQPWSNMICKIKLQDDIFEELQKLYNYTTKNKWKSFGEQLVGQINEEPEVTSELLEKFATFKQFCLNGVEQYVRSAMMQSLVGDNNVGKVEGFAKEEILTRITTMWFVNQKPGEYNPVHVHTNCKVSSVMYLRKPSRQIRDRKEHYKSDGMITFCNNSGTDLNFCNSQVSYNPEPGTMYIFPALQHHMVWPYRSEDPNDTRISLSFNADFTTKSSLDKTQKDQEKMYEEMKKMKESENDKSADVSDINKSG